MGAFTPKTGPVQGKPFGRMGIRTNPGSPESPLLLLLAPIMGLNFEKYPPGCGPDVVSLGLDLITLLGRGGG